MSGVSLRELLDKIDFLIDDKFQTEFGKVPDKVIITRSHVEELTRCGFYEAVQQHLTGKRGLEIYWAHDLPKKEGARVGEMLGRIPNALILARTSGWIFRNYFEDMVAYNLSSKFGIGDYVQAR